jgi:hypothetical protein
MLYLPLFSADSNNAEFRNVNKAPADSIVLEEMSTIVTEKAVFTTVEATVKLSVGTMTLRNGYLIGGYEIIVDAEALPSIFRSVARSKSEHGDITLPCNQSFKDITQAGGATLKGKGYCPEKKGERDIVCKIIPSKTETNIGKIELTIDSGHRIMHFESNYVITESVAMLDR